MLVALSIRDVVLITRLNLTLEPGLTVLTGETGAGKSILLDSLGLALGARADAGLLRDGAEQASVSAAFEVASDHPALALLGEQEIDCEDGMLVLRRRLGQDGRGRAFINDQPVSVGLLRQVGDLLVEVQGQFEQRGLLDQATHRDWLDSFGDLLPLRRECQAAWTAWREAQEAFESARNELAAVKREEEELRHTVEELSALAPEEEEEDRLAEQRAFLMHAERLGEAVGAAQEEIGGFAQRGSGAEASLSNAQRLLERVVDKAAGKLDPAINALDRAAAELAEAVSLLNAFAADLDHDPRRLAEIDERFFALKDAARKYGTEVAALPALCEEKRQRLERIELGDEEVARLEQTAEQARVRFQEQAAALTIARKAAAKRLDKAVSAELPALKLEKARFATQFEPLDEAQWGPVGAERAAFQVATNPGAPFAPLAKTASGGELSRMLLAIKVVLAGLSPAGTLVFDEVDSGVGGATAAAVGDRLERLAKDRQVLVVTHSPQVAALGLHHWRVEKQIAAERAETVVAALPAAERGEELARMLSGSEVTDEARAAAKRLMGTAR